ncbi:TPA: hypothetical protein ACOEDJ_001459 [Enterobacter asburiae]
MAEQPYEKVIIAICEGQHDVAFLSRVLLVNGFTLENKKIGQLPVPFNKRFEVELSEVRVPDKKLGFQAPGPNLPSASFKKDGRLVFVHNLNGDGRVRERQKLIEMYRELSGDDDFSTMIPYRFLYFFDADDIGIQERLTEIHDEVGLDESITLSNGSVVSFDGVEWGGYIFHDVQTDVGTLEDLLLNHFDNKVVSLKTSIEEFLLSNRLDEERTKTFVFNEGGEEYTGRSKYYNKKSVLGVFGQLQFSGSSNAVMINQTDFLRAVDIRGCQQCIIISGLFD